MATLEILGGAAAAGLLLVATLSSAYALANRLLDGASVSGRLTGAVVIAYWLLVALFSALAAAGLFRLAVVVPLAAAALGGLWWRGRATLFRALRRDLAEARSAARGLPAPLKWLLLAVGVLIAARMMRGLVAPPMGWDSLTYHLVKAARWAGTGSFGAEIAPDAWSYYEYFPYAGDVVWAWAMLPLSSDLLLAPAGGMVWLSVCLCAYGLGRQLELRREVAASAALAVGLLPAVAQYVTSSYIDNETVALLLAGVLFVQRAWSRRDAGSSFVAVAALGLLAAMRPSFIPVAAMGTLVVAIAVARAGSKSMGYRMLALAVCVVALAVAAPPYLRALIDHGSPLYPLELKLGPFQWEGNAQLGGLLAGRIEPIADRSYGPLLEALFWIRRPLHGLEHLNLGPLSPLVLLLGGVAALALARDRVGRIASLFGLFAAIIVVLSLVSDRVVALRTLWRHSIGRMYAPAVALLFVLAGHLKGRWTQVLWIGLLLSELVLAVPLSWGRDDWAATAKLTGYAALFAAAIAAALFAARKRVRARPILWTLAGICAVLFVLPAAGIRQSYRYRLYAAAARGLTYDVHSLSGPATLAYPIWERLDTPRPKRVAVTAGFALGGHNWFRYPLFGSRLQNEVVYVTPTRDGSIVSYRNRSEVVSRSSVRAWVRRLVERRIDFVAALAPIPPEGEAMEKWPALFEPVARGADGRSAAYRLRRESAVRWLGSPRGTLPGASTP